MTYHVVMNSPIGDLLLTSDGARITRLHMAPFDVDPSWSKDPAPLAAAVEQLDAYFAGELKSFELDLAPAGTSFQLKVWAGLRAIPYGDTISYAELARRIGNPRAVRAVGRANGANPIAVIVPCHRVIAADGTLGGYGGGLARKETLLALEGAWQQASAG